MITIEARNVNEAYYFGRDLLEREGERRQSRNGIVIEIQQPVCTSYSHVTERVLFHYGRNPNPFFHLFESIWIMAGRDDAAYPGKYAKQILEYAEESGRIHGAYGRRIRGHFGCDQLFTVADRLKKQANDRRSVITMWDPNTDFEDKKDLPCNTHLYFKVTVDGDLRMTICNRSNDVIWGAYGSNAVHFSILQEWMAVATGYDIGPMYQMSDSLHMYERVLGTYPWNRETEDPYKDADLIPDPVVVDPGNWLTEASIFCENPYHDFTEPFLHYTAQPMHLVWDEYKTGNKVKAHKLCRHIKSPDWRMACAGWVGRRIDTNR